MLLGGYPQFHLILEISEGRCWGGSALTSAMFDSFTHNKAGLALAAAISLCSYVPLPLQRTQFLMLARLVPVCPLPIYFLLPLTFHSLHACLLSEDRPSRWSPPHVQCDQYKGQGPCTQNPTLTKREGLKAAETVWWVPAHVCECVSLCAWVPERTSHSKTCK